MTQEDKELLLKDLCARLPYKLRVKYFYIKEETTGFADEGFLAYDYLQSFETEHTISFWGGKRVYNIVPYLRPMSSMTEEEKGEYFLITERFYDVYTTNDTPAYTGERMVFVDDVEELIDFYNSHHFDYRGLIEKGLAIEVTEENNPYK